MSAHILLIVYIRYNTYIKYLFNTIEVKNNEHHFFSHDLRPHALMSTASLITG